MTLVKDPYCICGHLHDIHATCASCGCSQFRHPHILPWKPDLPLPESGPLPTHVPTSWQNLDRLIPGIIRHFNLRTNLAIEFGVWHGYSTAGLANNFHHVIGIDTFLGDRMMGFESEMMIETTRRTLAAWPNVELWEKGYEQIESLPSCDVCHIDIIHTYLDTFACGLLALKHAKVVIFHDTESFVDVKRAVADLACVSGRQFYNWPHNEGLGILGEVQK